MEGTLRTRALTTATLSSTFVILLISISFYPAYAQVSYNNALLQLLSPTVIQALIDNTRLSTEYSQVLQGIIPVTDSFPCPTINPPTPLRSSVRPTSVDQLRPGDIDVIAALGDSITAGTAARTLSPLGIVHEDRGVSFSGGGLGTWREITTLPNILEVYNPQLIGQATGSGTFNSPNAKFNLAVPGSTSSNLLIQAQTLLSKLQADPSVNLANDWKMVTILSGHNDLCAYQCNDQINYSAIKHYEYIKSALDFIKNNIPRVFVNLVSIIDPSIILRIPTNSACDIIRPYLCPCILRNNNINQAKLDMRTLAVAYQDQERLVADLAEYKNLPGFAVVNQPFLQALNGPATLGGPETADFTSLIAEKLFTPDCFHLNQKAHAKAARLLWNNLLESTTAKTISIAPASLQAFKCQTTTNQFIFTHGN